MKLIIDIPEIAYEAYKEWHKNKVASAEQSLIANGIPYEEKPKYFPSCEDCNKNMEEIRQAYDKMKAMERPQGDLISREALKKTLCEEYEAKEHYIGEKMLNAIDNAPTVEGKLSDKQIEEIADLLENEWGYEGMREEVTRILRGEE